MHSPVKTVANLIQEIKNPDHATKRQKIETKTTVRDNSKLDDLAYVWSVSRSNRTEQDIKLSSSVTIKNQRNVRSNECIGKVIVFCSVLIIRFESFGCKIC